MKAAIVTLFDMSNVGNRLQNYAVTYILQQMGLAAETIIPSMPVKSVCRVEQDLLVKDLLENDPLAAQKEYPMLCRAQRFENFNRQYLSINVAAKKQYGREMEQEYSFFVAGSDQVWNPLFRSATGQINNRLLAFVPPEKRVCYAPSIGLREIPDIWRKCFSEEWKKYRLLSVRERSGAEIIRHETHRDATVLIDPTLMLDRQQWLSLARPLPGFDSNQGYILFYFLGNPEEELSAKTIRAINREAKKKGLQIKYLFSKDDSFLKSAGPQETLHLIANASLICTDSYHGTIFSILFGKPFLLGERKLELKQKPLDLTSRFDTLLQTLHLENRFPENQRLDSKGIWQCDYSMAYQALEEEREKALRFLHVSFGLEQWQ